MNSYIKWVTTEGEVARVKDSWNNIIWEKPRKLWINDYCGGPPQDSNEWTMLTDVQISYDRSTWINPTDTNQGEGLGTYTYRYFTIYPGRKFYIRFVYTDEDLGIGDPVDSGDDIYSIAMGVMKSSMDSYFETECSGWYENFSGTNLCTIAGITQLISEHQDALIQDYYGKGTGEILFNATNAFEDLVLIISIGSTTSGQVSWNLNNTIDVDSSSNTISFLVNDSTSKGWRIDSPEWVIINPSVGSGSCTVNMSVQKNTSIDKRSGTLELYNTTTDESASTVVLNQSGKAKRNPSWDLTDKTISDTTTYTIPINITDTDGKGWIIGIEGSTNVQFETSAEIRIYSGTGNTTVNLNVNPNTTTSDITATVSLKSKSQTISTKTITIVPTSDLVVEKNTIYFDPEAGDSTEVTVTSSKDYTISVDDNKNFYAFKVNNGVFIRSISVNYNSTTSKKLGNITISDGIVTKTIEVWQRGVEYEVSITFHNTIYTNTTNPSSVNNRILIPLNAAVTITCNGNCSGTMELKGRSQWVPPDGGYTNSMTKKLTANTASSVTFTSPADYTIIDNDAINSEFVITYGDFSTTFYTQLAV